MASEKDRGQDGWMTSGKDRDRMAGWHQGKIGTGWLDGIRER